MARGPRCRGAARLARQAQSFAKVAEPEWLDVEEWPGYHEEGKAGRYILAALRRGAQIQHAVVVKAKRQRRATGLRSWKVVAEQTAMSYTLLIKYANGSRLMGVEPIGDLEQVLGPLVSQPARRRPEREMPEQMREMADRFSSLGYTSVVEPGRQR